MTDRPAYDYDAVVTFRNEGQEYGRETYRVQAADRDSAMRAALIRSEDSIYDDTRIPCLTRRVTSCRRVLGAVAA